MQEYYGKTLTNTKDLATNACCVGAMPTKYGLILKELHPDVTSKFYGCGSPIPDCLEGCVVLDLGCGGGTDCFVASKLVGPAGLVIGVDMTEEMISTAVKYQEYHREKFGLAKSNISFRQGRIQDLRGLVEDSSVDVVISNCVINLVPSKLEVFKEIFRVLKPGGELYFSDVYSDRRVPEGLQKDKVLWGECLSGALYEEDFRRAMQAAGFQDLRVVAESPITIENPALEKKVGKIKFFSRTVRAFKLELEDRAEDYGQVASFTGEGRFVLDGQYSFPKGQDVPVCRNTATILEESRYRKRFVVSEPGPHQGLKTQSSRGCAPGCC